MLVKNAYQLNDAQRKWLYAELAKRKLMEDNQKMADREAAERRRQLCGGGRTKTPKKQRQQTLMNSSSMERARTSEIMKENRNCCFTFDDEPEYSKHSRQPIRRRTREPETIEELLQQLYEESSSQLMDFLALD